MNYIKQKKETKVKITNISRCFIINIETQIQIGI